MVSKPLGRRAYGSIGHLPQSRMGPGDHSINAGMTKICLEKPRKGDIVICQQKLDGTNVAVAKIDGLIVPLIRAGYPAVSSKWEQHRLFHRWVFENLARFDALINDGERICGEWLAQAHGTRYNLPHEPFVAFDLMQPHTAENKDGKTVVVDHRALYENFLERVSGALVTPRLLYQGTNGFPVEKALKLLEDRSYHGEIDEVEGAVWRVEREGRVDFLCKYVRPDKKGGIYLPEISGKEAIWNWRAGSAQQASPVAIEP